MKNLRELIKSQKQILSLTNKELAELSGINLSTINNIMRGQTSNPALDTVQKLAEALGLDLGHFNRDGYMPDSIPISTESEVTPSMFFQMDSEDQRIGWIFSKLDEHGKNMIRVVMEEELRRLQTESSDKVLLFPSVESEEKVPVLVYDEPAAAGSGNFANGDVSHTQEFLKTQVPDGTDFAVLVSGESMTPIIPDGSIAFIQGTPVIKEEDFGIFILDGQAYCKQLKMGNGKVVLHSLNPACPDVDVPALSEFRTLGKVLGYYNPASKQAARV